MGGGKHTLQQQLEWFVVVAATAAAIKTGRERAASAALANVQLRRGQQQPKQ
jgi:hypothetical protein